MNEKHKVNIYELAKATGYSTSTVSKVLNRTGRIGEETRKKVLKKAREMNYIPDYHAQSLAKKNSKVIGVIFQEDMGVSFSHPFYSFVLDAFRRKIDSFGYEMLFLSPNMGENNLSYVEYCRYRKVDGVLVVTFDHSDEQLIELVKSDIPVVCTDLNEYNTLTVSSDDFKGGQMAAQYLLDQGHKSIMHIAGPLTVAAALNRFLGYEATMKANGIDDYKLRVANNFTYDDGYHTVLELIERKRIPTGLFIASDWMAIGAIRALLDHGYKVPEDISVIGFDNVEYFKYSNPSLTTIGQNSTEIGEQAANLLNDAIEGNDVKSVVVDVELIERASCRKI